MTNWLHTMVNWGLMSDGMSRRSLMALLVKDVDEQKQIQTNSFNVQRFIGEPKVAEKSKAIAKKLSLPKYQWQCG